MNTYETTNDVLAGLYKKTRDQTEVHVLLTNGAVHINSPDLSDQNSYLEDEQVEAVLMVFLSYETASAYGHTLCEMDEELRPSMFSVLTTTLPEIYASLGRMTESAKGLFGAPLRIDLVEQLSEDTILSDTIYSLYVYKN
jgi:hypothetical protein